MEKATQLKIKLLPSDAQVIAMVTGFTADYVRRVLNGKRRNEVIEGAAHKLIKDREKLKESLLGRNTKPSVR